jgi:hypothetical protein
VSYNSTLKTLAIIETHCALEPFHKGKKTPRFNVNAKSLASMACDSKDYMRCRLTGYPVGTRYPATALDLQQWQTWDAALYESSNDDPAAREVTDITETLVYHLISAFLVGSDNLGETFMLEFTSYKYGQYSKLSTVCSS